MLKSVVCLVKIAMIAYQLVTHIPSPYIMLLFVLLKWLHGLVVSTFALHVKDLHFNSGKKHKPSHKIAFS